MKNTAEHMKSIPDDCIAYKRTPEFNSSTIPQGLLRAHKTKAGTWGRIVVLEGELNYYIEEPVAEELVLDSSLPGVVEPGMLHHIEPQGDVRFYVEFLRSGKA